MASSTGVGYWAGTFGAEIELGTIEFPSEAWPVGHWVELGLAIWVCQPGPVPIARRAC